MDTTDEVGRASVTITIPAGTPAGRQVLVVRVPETGTAIAIPIMVAAAKTATTTEADVNRSGIKDHQKVKYTVVVVAADGSAVTGVVTVTDGGVQVATATLTARDHGRVKFTLSSLAIGTHTLQAQFAGTDTLASSSSPESVVVVR